MVVPALAHQLTSIANDGLNKGGPVRRFGAQMLHVARILMNSGYVLAVGVASFFLVSTIFFIANRESTQSLLSMNVAVVPLNSSPELTSFELNLQSDDESECDMFDGRWEKDYTLPYYPPGSCPLIDRGFKCQSNGRPDNGYYSWRWQPNRCDIPRLNATDFLERLRGKRLVFVGDSLNRNMWESLVCILRHSIRNKKRVYETSGKKEFKKEGFASFKFEDFNCSVDYVTSHFLVKESKSTLRLDLMDKTKMYHNADVLVFNSGHWWIDVKTSNGENYYQEGNHVYDKLEALEAYRKALNTWAKWVEDSVDTNKTLVFFRGSSIAHFRGEWNSGGQCHMEREPILNGSYLGKYPSKVIALEEILKQMKSKVTYLNVTKLTDTRKDGHPSIYKRSHKSAKELVMAQQSQDCTHWCLPGVPDIWNQLFYVSLLKLGFGSQTPPE